MLNKMLLSFHTGHFSDTHIYDRRVPNWKLTLKNPTFAFVLTQSQGVSFQCNINFLFKTTRSHQIWP